MATLSVCASLASARLSSSMDLDTSAGATPKRLSAVPAQLRTSATSLSATSPLPVSHQARGDSCMARSASTPCLLQEEASESESSVQVPFPREGHSLAFVYGTLKKGFSNYWLMQQLVAEGNAIKVGTAKTFQKFPLVCGPFQVPFLLHLPGSGHRVFGELYEVNDKAVAALDVLEGVDRGHYVRCAITLSDVIVSHKYASGLGSGFEGLTQANDGAGLKVTVHAEAYFAGLAHTPGLAMAQPLESFDAQAAATYVPRKQRPAGRTFLEHVHAWIDDKRLLAGVDASQYKWPLSVI